jgi:hypothetical protein
MEQLIQSHGAIGQSDDRTKRAVGKPCHSDCRRNRTSARCGRSSRGAHQPVGRESDSAVKRAEWGVRSTHSLAQISLHRRPIVVRINNVDIRPAPRRFLPRRRASACSRNPRSQRLAPAAMLITALQQNLHPERLSGGLPHADQIGAEMQ